MQKHGHVRAGETGTDTLSRADYTGFEEHVSPLARDQTSQARPDLRVVKSQEQPYGSR